MATAALRGRWTVPFLARHDYPTCFLTRMPDGTTEANQKSVSAWASPFNLPFPTAAQTDTGTTCGHGTFSRHHGRAGPGKTTASVPLFLSPGPGAKPKHAAVSGRLIPAETIRKGAAKRHQQPDRPHAVARGNRIASAAAQEGCQPDSAAAMDAEFLPELRPCRSASFEARGFSRDHSNQYADVVTKTCSSVEMPSRARSRPTMRSVFIP